MFNHPTYTSDFGVSIQLCIPYSSPPLQLLSHTLYYLSYCRASLLTSNTPRRFHITSCTHFLLPYSSQCSNTNLNARRCQCYSPSHLHLLHPYSTSVPSYSLTCSPPMPLSLTTLISPTLLAHSHTPYYSHSLPPYRIAQHSPDTLFYSPIPTATALL